MTNKEFSDKYCKMCSSLVCAGINDELARDGCRHYQKEFLGKEKDDLEELEELLDQHGIGIKFGVMQKRI